MFLSPKVHKHYDFDDSLRKKIISCGYSSISMYVDKYDITYIKFLELKNGLDHHSGSKYERFLLEFTDLLRICFYY